MPSRLSVILVLGTTQTLAWGSTYYLPAILADPMAQDLGLGVGWVYGAFSVALVLAAFLGPAAGRRIDAYGGRGLLAVSSLIFAAGLALMGLAPGVVGHVVAWLVIGFGMGIGLYEAAFASLTALYGREARGPITGITLLAGLASTVCWPLSSVMEAEFGWRATCLVWAGCHLMLGFPLNRFALPVPAVDPGLALDARAASVAPPSRRAFAVLAFVFAVTWFTSTAMAAHLPRLLQQMGATTAMAVGAAALVGPAQVVARVLEAMFLRRIHPLLSARLACAAHPIGAALLLGLGAPAAVPFALCHGAGNGILTIAKGTLPLVLFGPSGYGLRQGWLMVPARLAQAASPLCFGLLMVHFGAGALWWSAGLGVAALGALLLLRLGGAEPAPSPPVAAATLPRSVVE